MKIAVQLWWHSYFCLLTGAVKLDNLSYYFDWVVLSAIFLNRTAKLAYLILPYSHLDTNIILFKREVGVLQN
jgi:hypothetical protein